MSYSQAANLAVNQTLVRSINTSVVALLPVAAILLVGFTVLGPGTLQDLSLALFVGIAVGTYSSIFIATPLLADLREREPAMQQLRKRAKRYQAEPGPGRQETPVAAAAGRRGRQVQDRPQPTVPAGRAPAAPRRCPVRSTPTPRPARATSPSVLRSPSDRRQQQPMKSRPADRTMAAGRQPAA